MHHEQGFEAVLSRLNAVLANRATDKQTENNRKFNQLKLKNILLFYFSLNYFYFYFFHVCIPAPPIRIPDFLFNFLF